MNIKCYIINLDRAKERWESTSAKFEALGFEVVRVPGVDGKTLAPPYENFAPFLHFCCRGRPISPQVVGCYMSHIKALEMFLATDDEYAMICEDDVAPDADLAQVIDESMAYAADWDLLRLNAGKPTRGIDFALLPGGRILGCDLKTASGNGAKIVNRLAARKIIETLPMRLPHDVILFYDLPFGVREVSVRPFPVPFLPELGDRSFIGGEAPPKGVKYALGRIFVTPPIRVACRTIRKCARWNWALKMRRKHGAEFKNQLRNSKNNGETADK